MRPHQFMLIPLSPIGMASCRVHVNADLAEIGVQGLADRVVLASAIRDVLDDAVFGLSYVEADCHDLVSLGDNRISMHQFAKTHRTRRGRRYFQMAALLLVGTASLVS